MPVRRVHGRRGHSRGRGRIRGIMFKGSITALVTPFRDGAVDWEAFEAFVDWQIQEAVMAWCRWAPRARARR